MKREMKILCTCFHNAAFNTAHALLLPQTLSFLSLLRSNFTSAKFTVEGTGPRPSCMKVGADLQLRIMMNLGSVFFRCKDERKLFVFVICGKYNRVSLTYGFDVKFLWA